MEQRPGRNSGPTGDWSQSISSHDLVWDVRCNLEFLGMLFYVSVAPIFLADYFFTVKCWWCNGVSDGVFIDIPLDQNELFDKVDKKSKKEAVCSLFLMPEIRRRRIRFERPLFFSLPNEVRTANAEQLKCQHEVDWTLYLVEFMLERRCWWMR